MSAPFWVWWLAPVVITVVAWVVVRAAQRPQRRSDHGDTPDDFDRFRRALGDPRGGGEQRPQHGPERRGGHG